MFDGSRRNYQAGGVNDDHTLFVAIHYFRRIFAARILICGVMNTAKVEQFKLDALFRWVW